MEIGLIDVDSHNFPNLALMKISAWHKQNGDSVEWWNGLKYYDRVYQSKIFDSTYTEDNEFCVNAGEIIKGGTGYDLKNKLPYEIEHQYPDYHLYGIKDTAYGFLTRGCFRGCEFCIVKEKEGNTHTVASVEEFWQGQKNIVLMDSNITASKECADHFKELAKTKAIVNFEGGAGHQTDERRKSAFAKRNKNEDDTLRMGQLRVQDIRKAESASTAVQSGRQKVEGVRADEFQQCEEVAGCRILQCYNGSGKKTHLSNSLTTYPEKVLTARAFFVVQKSTAGGSSVYGASAHESTKAVVPDTLNLPH